MKHCFRFLAERDGERLWRLSAEEAHHLTKVVKLGVGAQVEVTNGAGAWASGVVSSISKHEAIVESDAAQYEPKPLWRIGVALGALRPASVDDLLAPLTELGLDRFVIFQQAEQAKARASESVQERWKRILTNALKQSKRARMPELVSCASLADAITKMRHWEEPEARGGEAITAPLGLIADGSGPRTLLEAAAAHDGVRDIWIVIGSEKGLDGDELELLKANAFEPVSLGGFVLRALTAAHAAAACLALHRAGPSSKIPSK